MRSNRRGFQKLLLRAVPTVRSVKVIQGLIQSGQTGVSRDVDSTSLLGSLFWETPDILMFVTVWLLEWSEVNMWCCSLYR